jgi:hypothetical protein
MMLELARVPASGCYLPEGFLHGVNLDPRP